MAPEAELPGGQTLVLLVISHRHGDDYTLAETDTEAFAHVHEYVKAWWSDERERCRTLPKEIPADAKDAVDTYFACTEESWSTETITLPAGHPRPPRPAAS